MPRLHLTRLTQTASFDEQARRLLAQATANLPCSTDNSEEAIWNLAQYVDLVDAGFGTKDATYAGAKARLALYVRTLWQQPGKRSMFARSAALMAFVNDQLDKQEQAFELPLDRVLAASVCRDKSPGHTLYGRYYPHQARQGTKLAAAIFSAGTSQRYCSFVSRNDLRPSR